MPNQQNLFKQNRIGTLIVNSGNESRTFPISTKLTYTEKELLEKLASAEGISISELQRRAYKLYMDFCQYYSKLEKYKESITALLEKLP